MAPKNTKLQEEINALKAKVDELDNNYKRALADYQNQEKRFLNQRREILTAANEALITKLLPVVDDLERASSHLKDSGLDQVVAQLANILKNEGLNSIDPTGLVFDPQTMDCSEVVAGAANTIVRTVTKGYQIGDRLIRPARVEVGSGQLTKN